jgi:hypothetical protein
MRGMEKGRARVQQQKEEKGVKKKEIKEKYEPCRPFDTSVQKEQANYHAPPAPPPPFHVTKKHHQIVTLLSSPKKKKKKKKELSAKTDYLLQPTKTPH